MRPPADPLPPPFLYAHYPSTGNSSKGAAPTTAWCLGSFPLSFPFSSLPPPPLAFLSFTPTPLASSIHLHEYLKANTTMENMQQGQWDLSKRGKKAKCSFWDLEFPNLRQAMWWNSKWSNYRVLWRESKRENFNNTHWESDTSNSCPAGEKTGSTGGWSVGTSSWLCVWTDCPMTENAWCAEAHAGSHKVFYRTKQTHLFSQLQEFANVHIWG